MDSHFKVEYNTTFISDFEIGKPIGNGGTAKVYLVRRKNDKKIMAMKVINKNSLEFFNAIDEFKYHLLCSGHPNVIDVYGAYQDDKFVYLLLEYVPGKNLYEKMYYDEGGKFTEDKAKQIISQVSAAIKYCHKKGIVHRDIKPENILVHKNGSVRLIDFGLAFSINDKEDMLAGTIDYMAPEIILGKTYDKQIDWWSLGVLYYELVTGKTPFYDDEPINTKKRIVSAEITYPKYISSETKKMIGNLLKLNPDERTPPRACIQL